MLRKFLLLAVTLTLTACGGSKYPYPPQFVSPDDISPRSIPAPYVVNSPEWNNDLELVIEKQTHVTDMIVAEIHQEDAVIPEMTTDPVLGKGFNADNYPVTFDLLIKAGSDAWRIGDRVKDYWGTSRPWLADPKRVKLYAKPIYSPAYPSGHTVTNYVWAELLSDLMPEHRDGFYVRAEEVAQHRIMGGAHFPNDLQGGKLLAAKITAQMFADPEFRADMEAARAELKAKPVTAKKSCACKCSKGHCLRKKKKHHH